MWQQAMLILGLACFMCSWLVVGAQAQQAEPEAPTVSEPATAGVAVPRLIKFSGVLQDRMGEPLTGIQGVTLALYREQYEGAPLWLESQNVEADLQGRFSVLLGATQSEGMPLELFSSGEPRWVGVQAHLPGEVEQTRVLLVSVPYALKAADAETLGGQPLSAFVLAENATAEGGSSSTEGGFVKNGFRTLAVPDASGTTTGSIAKFINSTDLADSVLFESSGKIGLGTTTPVAALDVAGGGVRSQGSAGGDHALVGAFADGVFTNWRGTGQNATFYNLLGATNEHAGFGVAQGPNIVSPIVWMYTAGGRNVFDVRRVGFGVNPTDGLSLFTVRETGQVGIGIPGPAATLQLGDHGTGTNPNLRMGHNAATKFELEVDDGGNLLFQNTFGNNLGVWHQTGNVGIGTTTPTEKLEVAGNVTASGSVAGTQLVSNVSTGTPPLVVNSTTEVANLNASLLGGFSAGAFGDITAVNAGTGLTGGAASGAATLELSPAARVRGITYLGGCDTCGVLFDEDDQRTIYVNLIAPMTINSVTCFSDAGTPSINMQRDDGTAADILSANLVCSTSGAISTSFSGSENILNLNDKLDFVMVSAGGTAKRVTVSIKATLN